MNSSFVATVRQNPGRRFLIVDFRHPLRPDPSNQGKPGRKVRKGLGTDDRSVAEALVRDLNRLLADPTLHSPAARVKAEDQFDRRVVEIFYDDIEPKKQNYRALRDEHLRFPDDYPRVLLLGVPGAGKTTLVRQLIGSHPDRDRFPSTSANRTTTCDTEVIIGPEDFAAAITFTSEEETDFEIRQSVSDAVLNAINATSDADVAKVLLDRSDMRFRLKYVLGDWPLDDVGDDPYEIKADMEVREPDTSPLMVSDDEAENLAANLRSYVATIRDIATRCRGEVERHDSIDSLSSDDRNAALDLIQERAEEDDDYAALVSAILDDLRQKFEHIPFGRLLKTTTGWPRLWLMTTPVSDRNDFLLAVRFFSGIDHRHWGKLFAPLVNGIRVAGPFAPPWAAGGELPRLVLIDTEGLGHKADTTFDLPDHIVSRFPDSDAILLMHRGDAPFSFEGGKALEAIGGAGQTAKTSIVFSRMDELKGDNLKGWKAKRDYAFNGVRNVIDNQLSKSLTPDVGRFMLMHLEQNAFYLGLLQNADPNEARDDELSTLLNRLKSIVPTSSLTQAFPEYSFDLLVLALQRGVENFRVPWRAYLGLEQRSDVQPLPWQSVKAVSRRYAEGFDDGYHISPASRLLNTITLAIARFLENPVQWKGSPSPEDKRFVLDRIKATVSQQLTHFCSLQLRERPRSQWQEAYAFRGTGSTFDRKIKIEALYERWVPIPANATEDMRHVQEFIDMIKDLVKTAIDATRDELISRSDNGT